MENPKTVKLMMMADEDDVGGTESANDESSGV
jgi:hypothetical protein